MKEIENTGQKPPAPLTRAAAKAIMKSLIKNSVTRFRLTFPLFLAAIVLAAGCATRLGRNPLEGWHFYSRTSVSQAITDDYQDFIQELPDEKRRLVGDISFFEDKTGQHAVSIEVFESGKNASWRYAIIYNKADQRVRVIKYGYRKYWS